MKVLRQRNKDIRQTCRSQTIGQWTVKRKDRVEPTYQQQWYAGTVSQQEEEGSASEEMMESVN